MLSCIYRHFSTGPTCELINLKFLNSPALSDSEDDQDDEKDNLEKEVEEEATRTALKVNQDDLYIFLTVVFSLSNLCTNISMLKL